MQRKTVEKGVSPVDMKTNGVEAAPATESTSWFASCLSLFCLKPGKDTKPVVISVDDLEKTYPHGKNQPSYWD